MREVVFCPLTLRKSVDPHTSIEISAAGRLASGRLGRRRRMRVVAKREGSPIVGEPDELPFLGSLLGAGLIYWWALLADKGYPDDGHETERQYDPVEPERSGAAQRTTNISMHRFTQLTCLSSRLERTTTCPRRDGKRPHGEACAPDRLELDQLTLILRGFAFSAFGRVSMTTPSLSSALMRSWSMSLESWKLRA
jgi:hypothetical protein